MTKLALARSTLEYERMGSRGDPVVLIHGGWEDRTAWTEVAEALRSSFEVLVYDRRGHGGSVGPPRERPLRDDADELAELLESTGFFPVHLVGHSDGGAVALRLALDRPELARSAVVHEVPYLDLLDRGPTGPDEHGPPERALAEARHAVRDGAPERAARIYLDAFAAREERGLLEVPGFHAGVLANAVRWAEVLGDPEATRAPRGELESTAVPVLATAGERSPPFAGLLGERLAAELGNGRFARLTGAGHFPHRTPPGLWAGVVNAYLLERNVPPT